MKEENKKFMWVIIGLITFMTIIVLTLISGVNNEKSLNEFCINEGFERYSIDDSREYYCLKIEDSNLIKRYYHTERNGMYTKMLLVKSNKVKK